MLNLNRDHAAFDLALEILCTLPPGKIADDGILMKELAEEFGMTGQEPLRSVLEEIVNRGVSAKIGNGNGGRRAWIEQASWAKAEELCNQYWEVVSTI